MPPEIIIGSEENPYRQYPGKPVVMDVRTATDSGIITRTDSGDIAVKLEGKEVRVIPEDNYFDLVPATLSGLLDKLPPRAFWSEDLLNEIAKIEQAEPNSYGVYSFLPKRGHLVRHMSREWNELALLVSNSRLYNNPEGTLSWHEVRQIHKNTVVAIAGCSLGFVCALNVVGNLRPNAIKISDLKVAHMGNAPRAGWEYDDIDNNKAQAGARHIHHRLDPYIGISAYSEGINEQTMKHFMNGEDCICEPKATIVLDAMDDVKRKITLGEEARKAHLPYIMVSDLGSVVQRDVRRFDLDPTLSLAYGVSDEELYEKKDKADANPGNLDYFFEFVFAALGRAGTRGEFEQVVLRQIDLPFGGVPQLPSTVSAGAGVAAETVARMTLGWKHYERSFFNIDTLESQNFGEKY